MSADPRRITDDNTTTDELDRIRGLERRHKLGVQAAYYAGVTGFTLPDTGAETPVEMQGGVSTVNAPALTDNPDTFSIGVGTIGVFTGIHSALILVPGLYEATISADVPAEATNTTPKSQSLIIQTEGGAFFSESGMNFGGRLTHSFLGKQDVKLLLGVGSGGTLLLELALQNLRGGGTGDVSGQIYLELLRLGVTPVDDILI